MWAREEREEKKRGRPSLHDFVLSEHRFLILSFFSPTSILLLSLQITNVTIHLELFCSFFRSSFLSPSLLAIKL